MLSAVVIVGLFAPWLAPHEPEELNVRNRLQGTSTEHVFGTDRYGRDVMTRVMYGARVSLLVGAGVIALTMVVGVPVGLFAGFYPALDGVLMRVTDAFMAFPHLILAIGIMAAIGPRVDNIVLALGLVLWPQVARLTRSVVLEVRERPYVEAARAGGMRDARLLVRHILPNCVSPLVVQATFLFAQAILQEASLSFLGVGLPPYMASWGNMLSEAREFLTRAPWMAIFPGAAIMATVVGANLLGDGLRDVLDPSSNR